MVRGGGRGRRGGRDRSSPPAGRGGRGRSGGDGGGRSSSPAGQGGRGRRGGDGGGRSSSPAGQGGRCRGGDGDFDGGDRSSSSAGRGGRGRGGDSDGGASSPSSVSQGGRRDHGHGREHHGDGGDRSSSSASQGGRGDKATESPKSSPTPNPPSILGDPPADNYAARLKAPREELAAHRFFEFLQQCKQGSSGDPVYVAEVKSMRAKESWKLCVQFNHLRAFDRHFSHYVCNNRDRIWGWLLSAVRKFLVAQCIDDDKMTTDTVSMIRSDILLNADLEFIDITISIESLLSFLNNNRDGLSEFLNIQFETAKAELLPTDLGSHIFRSCVEHLIENHILGYSWNGDYTIGDWDIINGREVVLMKRPGEFTLQHGAADLGKLDSELILRYLKIDKDGNRVVPLYFKELDDDLKVLSTTIKSKDLHWYREYIRSHPALVPPMARIHLIRGLFREVRTFNLAADPLFKKLLTVPDKSCYVDWRPLITSTKSKVLLDIYWHGIPEAETKTTPPKFDASLGSLLDFKRNSCEHIEENSRDKGGKQLMKKSIEAEVFASSKVLKFLPWLIRKLLKKCNMEGCFREIWQVYKSSGFNYELAIRKSRG